MAIVHIQHRDVYTISLRRLLHRILLFLPPSYTSRMTLIKSIFKTTPHNQPTSILEVINRKVFLVYLIRVNTEWHVNTGPIAFPPA